MTIKTSSPQQKIIAFFLRHPDFAVNLINKEYAFSEIELDKFQHIINWEWINLNDAIDWNEKLICKYNSRLNWEEFSQNATFANTYLLETFKDQIDWRTEDDSSFWITVASNESIVWTPELIEKYQDRLNFNYLAMNQRVQWSEQLIDQYKHRWNWDNLMMNEAIPWTLPMLNRFFPYIDDTSFYFQEHPVLTGQLDIIEAYPKTFVVRAVCMNPNLPWNEKNLLNRWENKLDWNALAGNSALFRDPSFFETHLDKWLMGAKENFRMLSWNPALPWSISFIERFVDFWDWGYLCQNEGVPWNIEMIEHFKNRVQWGGREYLEDNSFICIGGLIANGNLPWSLDFLIRYEEYLDWEELRRRTVWDKAFKPYLDEKTVDTIFRLI